METNNKLREALKDIGCLVEQIHFLYSDYPSEIHEIARKVNAALAAPPRNCDVGTAEEQIERWQAFRNRYDDDCTGCPCDAADSWSYTNCFAKWAQMPYTEGGAK